MRINNIKLDTPFITKDNFKLFFPDIKDNSYSQNIKYWLKNKKIISLKRGVYIFPSFLDKCQDKNSYLFYLSSILHSPSYISKESILAKYAMLTEAVYGICAVTLKVTRSFASEIGIFNYCKIKENLFTGFIEREFIDYKYYIATKSKALFDYLYFYKRKMQQINENSIGELRINFDNMIDSEWKEFERYLEKAKSHKLDLIYKIIRP